MSVNRRAFLSAAVSLTAGGIVTLVLSCRRDEGRIVRAQIELSSHFHDPEAIELVGREAAEALPEGPDVERILDLVAPERGSSVLRQEIRSQYARGQTLRLRGWPVAMTEARIFALLALREDSSG